MGILHSQQLDVIFLGRISLRREAGSVLASELSVAGAAGSALLPWTATYSFRR